MTTETSTAKTHPIATWSGTPRIRKILRIGGGTVLVLAFLYACFFAVSSYNDSLADKATFEHVLRLSDQELQEKPVEELNEYRKALKNIYTMSGYPTALMNREINELEDLIMKKTDH